MDISEAYLLLPCYSLEDLSLERDAREANELLGGWTGLYHPAILAQINKLPRWSRADAPPSALENKLVVVPGCSIPRLPEGWLDEAKQKAGVLVVDFHNRSALLNLLACRGFDLAAFPEELVADFFALGYGYFQVELLTRQLRYMSNLDQIGLERRAVEAAQTARQGDLAKAREHLTRAFDLLVEGREYFYPVEAHLVDLTLLAPSTLGESLRKWVGSGLPLNILAEAKTVELWAETDPESLQIIRELWSKTDASLVGGEYRWEPIPLMPLEDFLENLKAGLAVYERILGKRPRIFGRRPFGLSPVLPQILRKWGFEAAVHVTLDEGVFPSGNQSRIRWVGLDETEIDALARIPLDAAADETFLQLGAKAGGIMDLDQAAAVILAHWPGRFSAWFQDLRRATRYCSVLGQFISLEDYLKKTHYAGQSRRYRADEYRSPYLRQMIRKQVVDPISQWVRWHQLSACRIAIKALQSLTVLVSGVDERKSTDTPEDGPAAGREELTSMGGGAAPSVAAASICPSGDQPSSQPQEKGVLEEGCVSPEEVSNAELELLEWATAFARTITGDRNGQPRGVLAVNPYSFPRQVCLELPADSPRPEASQVIRAIGRTPQRVQVVLEVPPTGFVWLPNTAESGESPSAPRSRTGGARKWWITSRAEASMVEEHSLRNEFFEVFVNPITGAVRSIRSFATGSNALGQELAFRYLNPYGPSTPGTETDVERYYTLMACESLEIGVPGPLLAECTARGRLVNRQGKTVARYVQSLRVRRGNPVLEIEITLEPEELPQGDPWRSYYAARFAWAEAASTVRYGVAWAAQPFEKVQLESPYFVEIDDGKSRFTILCAGLPFHRLYDVRKLDTLLVLPGETARKFRLGVAVDVEHAAQAALDFLAPPPPVLVDVPRPALTSAWLFHLSSRNVMATHWGTDRPEGGSLRLTTRLLETEGRQGQLRLRCFRKPRAAQKTSFLGDLIRELPIEDDSVIVEIAPYEWAQITILF